MGILSAAMKASFAAGDPRYALLEIDFPAGSVKWSRGGFSSLSSGYYEDYVKSFGRSARKGATGQGGIVSSTITITIVDKEQFFKKKRGTRERIQNSPARIKLATPVVAPELFWTGRLEQWAEDSRDEWTLQLKPQDVQFTDPFVADVWSVTTWPYADKSVRGKIMPLIYWRQDSSGIGGRTGTVDLFCVKRNADPFLYTPGWGACQGIDRVYDGETIFAEADYTVIQMVQGGARFTVVSFDTDQGPGLRADLRGIETIGDGTGTLVEHPTDIIKHIAVNRVFNRNLNGIWFPDAAAPVDTTSFAAVKAATAFWSGGQEYRSSAYLADVKFDDLLPSIAKQHGMSPMWTVDGKLGIKLDTPLPTGSYPTTKFRQDAGDVGDINTEEPSGDWVRRVIALYGCQVGDYIDSYEAFDARQPIESSEKLALQFGPGFK